GTTSLCRAPLALHVAVLTALAGLLPPPSPRKRYHALYFGGIGTDTHDPTEHDVTPQDVERYEETVGTKAAWIYFSDNWFESRKFTETIYSWIRQLGKIPYVRLMMRSDVDQLHVEKFFS